MTNMKLWNAIMGASVIAAASLAACGGRDSSVTTTLAPPPMGAMGQSLDTVQVLAQARQSSETSEPFPVVGGALTLTDTADTSEPVSINGP
jgi:hypothetical protein